MLVANRGFVSVLSRALSRCALLAIAAAAASLALFVCDGVAQSTVAVNLVPSAMDLGWNGLAHNDALLEGGGATLATLSRCDDDLSLCTSNADCTGGTCTATCDLPGGQCELTGPIGQRYCIRELAPCATNVDCGAGSCERFTSPPIPTSTSNTPACITSFAESDITGTYDPATGASQLSATLRWRVHLGLRNDQPCPRCGAPQDDPEIGEEFECEGGPRDGDTCTVDAVTAVFGGVSYDCPPSVTNNVSGLGLRIRLPEITTGSTERTAAIPCVAGGVCTDSGETCTTNADCPRCTDDLSACTSNSDCAAGATCAAAPAQPISCGFYCHCGFCNNDPAKACFSNAQCDAGETCMPGDSFTGDQDQSNGCADLVCGRAQAETCCSTGDPNCPTPTAQIGNCSLKPYIHCSHDVECAAESAGVCLFVDRPCFENVIERTGAVSPLGPHCIDDPGTGSCSTNADCAVGACVDDTAEPTYVALACVPKTAGSAINASRSIPGPVALTFNSIATPTTVTTTTTRPPEEDDDGDGIPYTDDPCFSAAERDFSSALVRVKRINKNTTPGDDGLRFKGQFLFPEPLSGVDPAASDVRIVIYSADGDVLTDVTVPSGSTWASSLAGQGFRFHDAAGSHNGIRTIFIRGFSDQLPTNLKIDVIGRQGTYPVTTDDLPIRASFVIGNGNSGRCGDAVFDPGDCTFGPRGRRLTCR